MNKDNKHLGEMFINEFESGFTLNHKSLQICNIRAYYHIAPIPTLYRGILEIKYTNRTKIL